MNEKIKELIEKSTTIEYGVDNGFDRVTFDKEKFAELIIRRMLDAIGNHPMQIPTIQRIKHSFGVEYYEPIEKIFGDKE